MQNEKTTGEIEHNIRGGELVLVIESEVRDRLPARRALALG